MGALNDLESQRLSEEARLLAEKQASLEEERGLLERARARFERECAFFGKGSDGEDATPDNDMVSLNLGGEANITVLRSTLTQCEDSMLAAAFSGRWTLPKDEKGMIFIDFEPAIFTPLVQHMRMRRIEDPCNPTPPPSFVDGAAGAACATPCADLEARFHRMLRYYGLEEWVYRDCLPEPLQHQMRIGSHWYAVLPPQSPDETIAFGDMSCQTVSIPRGWEVLQTDSPAFDDIIRELANHSWGALRLCCQNPGGAGFSSYLTRLHGGGTAGTRWSGDARMLQAVGAADGQQFRFASACSARLVLRAPDRQQTAAGVAGLGTTTSETQRSAAI